MPAPTADGRCRRARGGYGVAVGIPLPFDPVDRAGELWQRHWPDQASSVYASMRAVTSIMRAHQILLADLDAMLRPFGLTFSRYEALALLKFSAAGALPLSKVGERLQVHATSVTNIIDRLEAAGFVSREPNPRDGRGTLAVLTESGRAVTEQATARLNEAHFGLSALVEDDLDALFDTLRRLRLSAGDFRDDAEPAASRDEPSTDRTKASAAGTASISNTASTAPPETAADPEPFNHSAARG